MKERIKEIGYVLEDIFRKIVGEITPEKKLVIILSILLIGTLANLYMTFKAVQSMGGDSNGNNTLNIKHIEQPEIITSDSKFPDDSLKGGSDETEQL
jgi:hypothetical protein